MPPCKDHRKQTVFLNAPHLILQLLAQSISEFLLRPGMRVKEQYNIFLCPGHIQSICRGFKMNALREPQFLGFAQDCRCFLRDTRIFLNGRHDHPFKRGGIQCIPQVARPHNQEPLPVQGAGLFCDFFKEGRQYPVWSRDINGSIQSQTFRNTILIDKPLQRLKPFESHRIFVVVFAQSHLDFPAGQMPFLLANRAGNAPVRRGVRRGDGSHFFL